MAKISIEFQSTIRNLQQALLYIVDDAKAVEFILLERYGETEQTIVVLDELSAIAKACRGALRSNISIAFENSRDTTQHNSRYVRVIDR